MTTQIKRIAWTAAIGAMVGAFVGAWMNRGKLQVPVLLNAEMIFGLIALTLFFAIIWVILFWALPLIVVKVMRHHFG
jgi:hypothetical protein